MLAVSYNISIYCIVLGIQHGYFACLGIQHDRVVHVPLLLWCCIVLLFYVHDYCTGLLLIGADAVAGMKSVDITTNSSLSSTTTSTRPLSKPVAKPWSSLIFIIHTSTLLKDWAEWGWGCTNSLSSLVCIVEGELDGDSVRHGVVELLSCCRSLHSIFCKYF